MPLLNKKDDEYKMQKRTNALIERKIRRDKVAFYNEEKILLLGAGGSGKSTVIKQMVINYGQGFQKTHRMDYISSIHRNLLSSIMSLIGAMETLTVVYDDELCERYSAMLKDVGCEENDVLSDDMLDAIQHIWRNARIQDVYKKQNSFQLIDSAKYYLDSIDRIKETHFIPSVDDVIHTRVPSSGVREYCFDFHGVDIRMIDVGGQRTERRKWLHHFEDVTSVLFVAALTEYDMPGIDDEKINRMIETLQIFKGITSLSILKHATMILFLNKTDNFEEKIQYSPLAKHFPAYEGPEKNAKQARAFILNLFINANGFPKEKVIYSHFTCATRTDDIKQVFLVLKDTVLSQNLCVH